MVAEYPQNFRLAYTVCVENDNGSVMLLWCSSNLRSFFGLRVDPLTTSSHRIFAEPPAGNWPALEPQILSLQ